MQTNCMYINYTDKQKKKKKKTTTKKFPNEAESTTKKKKRKEEIKTDKYRLHTYIVCGKINK